MQETLIQLRESLARFRAEGREFRLFFRADDVDEDEDSLRKLLELFLEAETPVNLQIIPERLTGEGASLLLRHHRSRPDLFELNQHGRRHVNHEREGRKCEFGPSRGFDEQLADLAGGRRVLEERLGEAFSPVFTPPWNRCTAETFRALDQLGYHGFSGLRRGEPVSGYRFSDVSVTLDFQKGAAVPALIAQLPELETIGIMLHHKLMDEGSFDFLSSLIEELARAEVVKFHRFQAFCL